VGEALISTLAKKGVPSMVQRTLIRPPSSRMGPITPQERKKLVLNSPVYGLYDEEIDRESAFEILAARADKKAEAAEKAARKLAAAKKSTPKKRTSRRMSKSDRFFGNLVSTIGRELGRQLIRGILGSLRR